MVRCSECSKSFSTKSILKSHRTDHHSLTCVVKFRNNDEKIALTRVKGIFTCPMCGTTVGTRSGVIRHASSVCEGVSIELHHGCEVEEPVRIPKAQQLPLLPVAEPSPISSFEHQVLFACAELNSTEKDKKRVLALVDCLGLEPFAIKDPNGMEQAALTNAPSLKKLCTGDTQFSTTIIPSFRQTNSEENQCSSVPPIASLRTLLATSPYPILQSRAFSELSKPLCDFVNEDWTFQPERRYACSQLFAGCILLNTTNGHAIMANSIEVYGRKKQTDMHREHFLSKKGTATRTSLPPKTTTTYDGVWPLTTGAVDGEKLVIGTRSFNTLVTSSIRLDRVETPSVGGLTSTFLLWDFKSSNATRIFLDQRSIERALKIASSKNENAISKENIMEQLRQVRSKFDDPSTYLLCRSAGYFTNDHTCQPFTVFTLANSDSLQKGNGAAGAMVFNKIAKNVLMFGSEATLQRKTIESAIDQSNGEGSIVKALKNTLELFKETTHTSEDIPILANKLLCKELEAMADGLSSYIAEANKTVLSFVTHSFNAIY